MNIKKNLLIPLFSIFLFLNFFNGFANDPKTLEIGMSAPDFNLPGTDGKNYSLKNFVGSQVLVIIFTCNHCPTAQAYEDRMITLTKDYQSKGVSIVAISPNDPLSVRLDELGYSDMGDTFEEMKLRVKEKGYNFPYLYDGATQKAATAYGPVATPHAYVFNKDRKLKYTGRLDRFEKPGSANAEDLRAAIDAILEGKALISEKTKTFGCSVKWADKRELVSKGFEDWAKEVVSIETIEEEGLKELIKNNTNKLRLINVWATWCGPCVVEFPEFVSINRMYRGRDFEFISISADKPDKKDKALNFLKKAQASNKNYIFNSDDKYKLIEAIDPNWQGALPYTLLIEPGGNVVYRIQNTIKPQDLKKKIVENKYIGRFY